MKAFFNIVILLLLASYCFSQNLVPNPGFEEYYVCPQSINTNKANSNIAPYWKSPSYGTPDLYNRCSKYHMGIQNTTGFTTPFSGDGFAGIVIWEGKKGYREYLQVELLEPLKNNHSYKISFYYKLSSYSKYSADRIGFSLTDTSIFHKIDTEIPINPTYSKIKDKPFDPYTGSWELLETEYLAKGGERYLTIGNFHSNKTTNIFHLSFEKTQEPMLDNAAYYYIDEVSISEKLIVSNTDNQSQAQEIFNHQTVNFTDSYILENVLFEHDRDNILPDSYKELNLIIEILNKHPDWKIKIEGHTDDLGSIEYNQNLSERRAYSVKKFLISNGIHEYRIHTKGYGNSRPFVDNSDDNKRKINRRVEIRFMK